MLRCTKCGMNFDHPGDRSVTSISGSIMGDEYIESLYFCTRCGVYTIEICHDRFLGEADVRTRGPVSRNEGEALVRLIERCPEPWNKRCHCEAHKEYFSDALD